MYIDRRICVECRVWVGHELRVEGTDGWIDGQEIKPRASLQTLVLMYPPFSG